MLNVDAMSDTIIDIVDEWDYIYYNGGGTACSRFTGPLSFPELGGIDTVLPPNAKELTFVFWTSEQGREVAPSCCAASKRPDTDTSTRGENDASADASDDEDEHGSCWEDSVWRDLAEAVAPLFLRKLGRITIVNASSIIPTGEQWRPILSSISTCVVTHAKL